MATLLERKTRREGVNVPALVTLTHHGIRLMEAEEEKRGWIGVRIRTTWSLAS